MYQKEFMISQNLRKKVVNQYQKSEIRIFKFYFPTEYKTFEKSIMTLLASKNGGHWISLRLGSEE